MTDTAPPEESQELESSGPRGWHRWSEKIRQIHRYLVPRSPEYDPPPFRRGYLLAVFVIRRFFIEDLCGGMAAVLTVHTLLSLVPIIGVALLVVGLMGEAAGAELLHDMFRSIVPETTRATDLAQGAFELASNVTISNLGAWGFMGSLVIAFVLFQTLETIFNRIWRVGRKRSVLVKFTMFYTLATLGPFVILFSLAQQLLPGFVRANAFPLLTTSVGLVLINRFLPYTKVRWNAALTGGISAAVLLELGKWGFGLYVTRFALSTYEGLYGPLAIFPVLIAWSYLSWSVVLMGAQLAFAVQHRRAIALLGYMNRYVLNRKMIQRPSSRTATRIMLAICDRYSRQRLGLTVDEIAERFGLGLDLVAEIVNRLRAEGLLLEADDPPEVFIPGRPLHQIRVLDVLMMFELEHARRIRDDHLGAVLAAIDRAREDVVGQTTYEDLVRDTRSAPPAVAVPTIASEDLAASED